MNPALFFAPLIFLYKSVFLDEDKDKDNEDNTIVLSCCNNTYKITGVYDTNILTKDYYCLFCKRCLLKRSRKFYFA